MPVPMQAPGPQMPPPGMPPEGGGMSAGGPPPGPSPDDLAGADAARMQEQLAAIDADAPPPKEAVPIADVMDLKSALGKFLEVVNKALGGEMGMASIEWEPPKGEKTWSAPLPPPMWRPLLAILALTKQVGDGKWADKAPDPYGILDKTTMQHATVQIEKLAGDKKFIDAITESLAPVEGEEEPAPMAPEGAATGGALERAV